jgi:predicted peptidase
MFAAAVPICGRGDTTKGTQISRTPVWAFHGEADLIIPVTTSREMIAAVRRAGGRPRYTDYRGVGHNSWDNAFREPELFAWLFAQQRRSE